VGTVEGDEGEVERVHECEKQFHALHSVVSTTKRWGGTQSTTNHTQHRHTLHIERTPATSGLMPALNCARRSACLLAPDRTTNPALALGPGLAIVPQRR